MTWAGARLMAMSVPANSQWNRFLARPALVLGGALLIGLLLAAGKMRLLEAGKME